MPSGVLRGDELFAISISLRTIGCTTILQYEISREIYASAGFGSIERPCIGWERGEQIVEFTQEGETMRVFSSLLALGLLTAPALAETKSFNDVAVVDVMCSKKVAANPDAHTRECALACEDSGFGIVTADGKFLKFDADGNTKMAAELKASKKVDHIRVDVKGNVDGDTIKVDSVKLL
jgi:hypothetical protein